MKKIDRTNETNISNEGYLMKIVKYNNAHDITVEFQDEYKLKVHTQYEHFKSGNIKNPYHPSVFDVGYLGEGRYKAKENGKKTKIYDTWKSMLRRCYEPYYINKHLTYIDCTVCEDWYNFQIFAEWYENNYYEVENERMELDKDILCKGNKMYSPNNCIFVPKRINTLFIKSDKVRGKYPIGIYWCKKNSKFIAQCNISKNDKKETIYLGSFDSSSEAFNAYKIFKENYIKQVADEYYSKGLIPKKLYDAMYRYEVEIND